MVHLLCTMLPSPAVYVPHTTQSGGFSVTGYRFERRAVAGRILPAAHPASPIGGQSGTPFGNLAGPASLADYRVPDGAGSDVWLCAELPGRVSSWRFRLLEDL